MRRITLLLTVALVMAAMSLAMALPAFAVANGHASCTGAASSNQTEPGAAGDFHSWAGQAGSNGDFSKVFARVAPPGPDRDTSGVQASEGRACSF